MKIRFLALSLVVLLGLAGCAKYDFNTLDVSSLEDLTVLQSVIEETIQAIEKGSLDDTQAQILVDQLQQRYIELTDNDEDVIEQQFQVLQTIFSDKSWTSYSLPLRAKKLGMTLPQGMHLDRSLSTSTDASVMLVYTGDYTLAMQQAERIAKKAKLAVSKHFQQAQTLAQIGAVGYISGLDTSILTKGIVYVNHELLDTNMDNFLSVSVDQDGVLTIEATSYSE